MIRRKADSSAYPVVYNLKSLLLRTLIVSAILFGMLVWADRNDPDPFDWGSIVFFLIIAAVSQAISTALFYSRVLLNTYPHILSNVIAIVAIMVTILVLIVSDKTHLVLP